MQAWSLHAASAGGGGTPDTILSLTIIPSDITVGNLQDTGQFLAIGTFATPPAVRDLTNSPSVTWISSLRASFQSAPTRVEVLVLQPASPPRTAVETAPSLRRQRAATAQYKPPPQHLPAPWFSQTRRPLLDHASRVRRHLRFWRHSPSITKA